VRPEKGRRLGVLTIFKQGLGKCRENRRFPENRVTPGILERKESVSMQKLAGLEDQFLDALLQKNCSVTVFLMNGFQMRGAIAGYDQDTILVWSDGKQNMIYKHAVSTISPSTPVPLDGTYEP